LPVKAAEHHYFILVDALYKKVLCLENRYMFLRRFPMNKILKISGFICILVLIVGVLSAFHFADNEGLLDEALTAFYTSQNEGGMEMVETVLESDPDNARAMALRALFKLRLDDGEGALEDANAALERDSQEPIAYAARSWFFAVYQEDLDASNIEIDKAMELDPDLAMLHSLRGSNYLDGGDLENALINFERAVELEPNYVIALWNLASIYEYTEDFAAAKKIYDRLVDLTPEDPQVYMLRGYIYDNEMDYDNALDDYTRAIELGVQDPWLFNARGWVYTNLGDYATAVADHESAIELDPENADYYNNAAYSIAQGDGDLEKAMGYVEQALVLLPGAESKRDTQGYIYYKMGENETALEIFSALLEEGEYTYAYYGRGLVYQALGETENAIGDFQAFLDAHPEVPESDDARQRIEDIGG
jgi:tetratricopeptide (TPR) repeat protein